MGRQASKQCAKHTEHIALMCTFSLCKSFIHWLMVVLLFARTHSSIGIQHSLVCTKRKFQSHLFNYHTHLHTHCIDAFICIITFALTTMMFKFILSQSGEWERTREQWCQSWYLYPVRFHLILTVHKPDISHCFCCRLLFFHTHSHSHCLSIYLYAPFHHAPFHSVLSRLLSS